MTNNDLFDELQRLRQENCELHELLAAAREDASPAPRLVPAEDTVAEAADGGIVTIAFNLDGQVWTTRLDVLTPGGPDGLLDCRSDAERFLFSAHLECAADDAALQIERARAAVNAARQAIVITMQVSADAMPADDLLALRRAVGAIDEGLRHARRAYSNLLDAGARRDVALPLHPGLPNGMSVVAAGSPLPPAATMCTPEAIPSASGVLDDDAFWTAAAQSLLDYPNGEEGSDAR
jgi:hypothetical protein